MKEFEVKGVLFQPVLSIDVDGHMDFDMSDSFQYAYDAEGDDGPLSSGQELVDRMDLIVTPAGETWDEVAALRRLADYIERQRALEALR